MYRAPNLDIPSERLAHFLSEIDNDAAPIGWENYLLLATALLSKFPIESHVMDKRFGNPLHQPGRGTERKTSDDFAAEYTQALDKTPHNSIWRHKASGQTYRTYSYCWIEATADIAVTYRPLSAEPFKPVWARPLEEFLDKFERVQ